MNARETAVDSVVPKSVLFISHDAVRAGATLMLLNFLRWLKQTNAIPFQVLICRGGGLEKEFEKLSPVWYLDPRLDRQSRMHSAIRQLVRRPAANVVGLNDAAARIGAARTIGLIYSNTVVNGRVLNALLPLGCPIVTHVHELEFAIRTFAGKDFDHVKRHTDRFIAVSDAARANLVERHAIPADKIERVWGFIPSTPDSEIDPSSFRRALIAEIGCPEDTRIVGGCGAITLHKGSDLFVQLALAIRKRAPLFAVHFVWVGAEPESDRIYTLTHDVECADLKGQVHFIGPKASAFPYIAAFDVLALVSREESLSLAMLEAATAGVPTVTFDGHGSREFVETDAGAVVPYLDIDAMAERILEMLRSAELREKFGARAREKVRQRHAIEVAAPQLGTIIQRMLTNEQRPNSSNHLMSQAQN